MCTYITMYFCISIDLKKNIYIYIYKCVYIYMYSYGHILMHTAFLAYIGDIEYEAVRL